ncbi:uncharacterized protein N7458_011261 [Penicillium daleae]|uniref:Glycosyltransferase 2-like domain-containing protein n=1 Tax=Penicillium daleae TaxID=63821 RepID=A0AAD6FXA9_9EURO|nr:uncharacterized protein N7458_011261 [Penicillium daleae]KAJ5432105.1 hypothetical protein N7458_011261 [Penicillium daleae]
MEQKETGAINKATELISQFEMVFSCIQATFHPFGVVGEIAGKSSNVAYAARHIMNVHARDGDPGVMDTLITVIDADTHLLQDYFSEIRRLHLDEEVSPERSFYSCPIIFDRNSLQTPALVRCADLMWGFAGISAMYPSSPICIPTSVYTLPLALAKRVGGWDSDASAIGEDMHMLLKCYFSMNGNITTRVVYSAASQCNVSSHDIIGRPRTIGTLVARYRQALRHMWGALDTGYAIQRSFGSLKRPSWRLLFTGKHLALVHLLWEAHFLPCHLAICLLITSIYSALTPPELIHPDLLLALNWAGILRASSFIMMNICIIVYDHWHYFCVNTRSLDMMDAGIVDAGFSFRYRFSLSSLVDRIIFPVAGTVFGPIPAVQAVISHFWTDRLEYQVSQKPTFLGNPV